MIQFIIQLLKINRDGEGCMVNNYKKTPKHIMPLKTTKSKIMRKHDIC